ncbi:hypothetical protein [Paeniglutamicibacter terrestris]|uniref:Uncharacterized protein n=1 Tax=Paeniglutamicibacter terrestris TaxID=2723403 RepID=A0ABX1GA25_9MICC|nr:hypothetical protein [Paeniglutamicibacter terrestris]NKG22385.1 hypothetical protein [Paeniglutamicibacter terrestris]
MSGVNDLAQRVGLVALTQAEVDEWLVEALIALLHPLDPTRVQLLVGKNSLDQKRALVKDLTGQSGFPIDTEVSPGMSLRQLLAEIKKLNDMRDRVVHSYYERGEGDQKRLFRSRKPAHESVTIDEIDELIAGLESCVGGLRTLVEQLSKRAEGEREAMVTWDNALSGVHEVILGGHLEERKMLSPIVDAVGNGAPIYLRIRGLHREFVGPEATVGNGEFLAKIDPGTWRAVITSSSGEEMSFGDTGWREITSMAQEEDPQIEFAAIRRIGDTVKVSFEGAGLPTVPDTGMRDRLAERAFGRRLVSTHQIPAWAASISGFQPNGSD